VSGADGFKVLDDCFAWRRTPEDDAWAKNKLMGFFQNPVAAEVTRGSNSENFK
jgi:hypothetical protein